MKLFILFLVSQENLNNGFLRSTTSFCTYTLSMSPDSFFVVFVVYLISRRFLIAKWTSAWSIITSETKSIISSLSTLLSPFKSIYGKVLYISSVFSLSYGYAYSWRYSLISSKSSMPLLSRSYNILISSTSAVTFI